jgi:dihydroorotate dehydrogenase
MRPTDTAASMLARAAMPVLLRLEPERAHALALRALRFVRNVWSASLVSPDLEVEILGRRFTHPVGLAAGFDKDGEYLDALGALGFSHVEVGTVTPRPQAGNPRPRLFRIRHSHALLNRMGFNSKGADHVAAQLHASRFTGVRGISIGKNADTPLERGRLSGMSAQAL